MSEKLSRRSALAATVAGLGVFSTTSFVSAGDKKRRQQTCRCQCQQPANCCACNSKSSNSIEPLTNTNVCRQFQFANFGNGVYGYYALGCPDNTPMAWYGPLADAFGNGCTSGSNCEALNKDRPIPKNGKHDFPPGHKADRRLPQGAPLPGIDQDTTRTPIGYVSFPAKQNGQSIYARIAIYRAVKNGRSYTAFCGEEVDTRPEQYTAYEEGSKFINFFSGHGNVANAAEVRYPADDTGEWYLIITQTPVHKP